MDLFILFSSASAVQKIAWLRGKFKPILIIAKLFCEYNSLNGYAKKHISKLSAIYNNPHPLWMGRTCGVVVLLASICMVTLGLFRSWHHGAYRHGSADRVFFESAFPK